jgi:hypothetical protein
VLTPLSSRATSLPVSTRRAIFDDNLGHIFQDVRDAARRHGFDDPRTHVISGRLSSRIEGSSGRAARR